MAYNTYYYIKSENRCCEFNSATQHRPCKRQSLFVSEASDLSILARISVYFPSHNDTFGVVRCRNMATQHAVPGVPSRSLSNQLASCAMALYGRAEPASRHSAGSRGILRSCGQPLKWVYYLLQLPVCSWACLHYNRPFAYHIKQVNCPSTMTGKSKVVITVIHSSLIVINTSP